MTSPLPQPWFTEAFLWEFLCQQGPIETFSSSPNQRRSIGALPFPNGSGSRIDHWPPLFRSRGNSESGEKRTPKWTLASAPELLKNGPSTPGHWAWGGTWSPNGTSERSRRTRSDSLLWLGSADFRLDGGPEWLEGCRKEKRKRNKKWNNFLSVKHCTYSTSSYTDIYTTRCPGGQPPGQVPRYSEYWTVPVLSKGMSPLRRGLSAMPWPAHLRSPVPSIPNQHHRIYRTVHLGTGQGFSCPLNRVSLGFRGARGSRTWCTGAHWILVKTFAGDPQQIQATLPRWQSILGLMELIHLLRSTDCTYLIA